MPPVSVPSTLPPASHPDGRVPTGVLVEQRDTRKPVSARPTHRQYGELPEVPPLEGHLRRFVSRPFADGVIFGATSLRSVHVGTVVDTYDTDDPDVVGLVHHPVRTSTGRPESRQFLPQRVSHHTRCLDKRSGHELDGGCSGLLGQPCQGTLCAGGHDEPVCRLAHRRRYLARSSSAVTTLPRATSCRARSISLSAAGSDSNSKVSSSVSRSSGAHDDGGSATVAGQYDAVVLVLDTVHDLREVSLDLGEGQRLLHDHDYGHIAQSRAPTGSPYRAFAMSQFRTGPLHAKCRFRRRLAASSIAPTNQPRPHSPGTEAGVTPSPPTEDRPLGHEEGAGAPLLDRQPSGMTML